MIHDQKSLGFAKRGSFSIGECGLRFAKPPWRRCQDQLSPSVVAGPISLSGLTSGWNKCGILVLLLHYVGLKFDG